VNFCITNYPAYASLNQTMVGSANLRTNILENFFILSRDNINGRDTWTGTGYAVYFFLSDSIAPTYGLYTFSTNCTVSSSVTAAGLFAGFTNFLAAPTNYTHLVDGVLGLRVQAFDSNGNLINTNSLNIFTNVMQFSGETVSDVNCAFYSNALPATVEIELTTLEDRTLQHAESLSLTNTYPWLNANQWAYLGRSLGNVHVFRQMVSIPTGGQ
jgi:hypothetical protein